MSPLWFVVEVEVILIWKVCQVRKLEILELEREPGCVFQVGWVPWEFREEKIGVYIRAWALP
jgi:hypothetical protein